jgi:murein DD-endopeptidase MepM/ murein hydrolase activator NlpD
MTFPLKNFKLEIPYGKHPGAFGFKRKYDIHTGIDLYCNDSDSVFAIEDGVIVNIEQFTGPEVGSDWWNSTFAVMIEGISGVINYGELYFPNLKIGDTIKEGDLIGNVKQVLKSNKIREDIENHSCSMLHIELYKHGTTKFVDWINEKPFDLLDPTELLLKNNI